jgi:hypothetical protein
MNSSPNHIHQRGLERREGAEGLAGGVDRDVAAADQLDAAERGLAIIDRDAMLIQGPSWNSFRVDPPPKQITASGFVRAIRAEARSFSGRHSLSAPSASHLKLGVVVLADADPPFGQPCDPDLTGTDEAATGRLADAVELAPLPESKNALRCSAR